MTRWILGIDPDVNKSGVCLLDTQTRRFVSVGVMTFHELVNLFYNHLPEMGYTRDDLKIVVEDSWTGCSHIFKSSHAYNERKNASMGYDVGRCHQVGRMILEIGTDAGLNIMAKPALRKRWSDARHNFKCTQEEIAYFVEGWPERSNQEERDAALLAWDESGLPVRQSAVMRQKIAEDGENLGRNRGNSGGQGAEAPRTGDWTLGKSRGNGGTGLGNGGRKDKAKEQIDEARRILDEIIKTA